MSLTDQMVWFITTGLCAGLLSGLLGIGGGLVVVPVLAMILIAVKTPVPIMQVTTATSLAIMVFTTFSSTLSHARKQSIDWKIGLHVGLGSVAGAFVGRWLSAYLSSQYIAIFFVISVFYIALRMFRPYVGSKTTERQMPISMWWLGGCCIGIFASLLGLGGGVLMVPFLLRCRQPMHMAIGISCFSGFIVAIASTLSAYFLTNTVQASTEYMLGQIYWPAWICIASVSVLTAPVGVWLAHYLPAARLKKVFAVFLVFVSLQMLYQLLKT